MNPRPEGQASARDRAKAEALAAVTAQHRAEDIASARDALRRLLALTEADAPNVVKMHLLIYVAVPKLARLWGVENLTAMVSHLLARGLAFHAGVCTRCLKERALHQSEESLCLACHQDVRELEARLEATMADQASLDQFFGDEKGGA